jgi:hypothetical protein
VHRDIHSTESFVLETILGVFVRNNSVLVQTLHMVERANIVRNDPIALASIRTAAR